MSATSSSPCRPRVKMTNNMVTTAFTLAGYRIVQNLGLVRGIVVRSRSIIGTIGPGLQTIVGGNTTLIDKAVASWEEIQRLRPRRNLF